MLIVFFAAAIIIKTKFPIVPKKKTPLESHLKPRIKGMSILQTFLSNSFLTTKISCSQTHPGAIKLYL